MNTFLRSDLFVSMCNCHFWWRWTFIEWFYSACSIDRWTCDICSRWTSSEQLLCNLMMSDHFEMSPERWTSIKWTSPSVVTEQSTVTDVNEQHPWNAFLQVLFAEQINVTSEYPLNQSIFIQSNLLFTVSFKITSIDEHQPNAFVPIVHFELNVIPSTLLNILQMHLFQLVQLLWRH